MQQETIFEFESYRAFLTSITQARGKRGGFKSELANAMGSHPAYLSRILAGQADLSLEQAEKLSAHLRFDSTEKKYFLFMVEEERAGTPTLKRFFKEERAAIQKARLEIKNRIPQSEILLSEIQPTYYSSWIYSAVHAAVTIPSLADVHAIANYLGLSPSAVRQAVEFLESVGLIRRQSGRWTIENRHFHIDKTSPLLPQHHRNWRVKSMQALDDKSDDDVRYSAAFALSENDAALIRETLLKNLKDLLTVVSNSQEEKVFAYNFDFFELKR